MKIVCISASKVPSALPTASRSMKACQALQQLGHQVTLLVPGKETLDWDSLKRIMGC
jgi:hypothetical protein